MLGFEYLTPTTDASGNTDYAGTTYYYEKNIFGDVVAIYDENGTKVGAYGFNSFGQNNVVTNLTDDSIASLNPIRYRSYYYDTDIYLYYLQSRYYDPVTCRFINADDTEFLGADGTPLSYNLFTYCMNDPVNRFDENGNWSLPNWAKLTIGAVATVAAVAITVATGGAALPVLIGVAASTIGGAVVSAVNHRVTTGSWEGADTAAWDGAVDGFMWGGIGSFASAGVGALKAVKIAKQGIAIGESMQRVTKAAQVVDGTTYKVFKGYNLIKKIPKIGTQLADDLSLMHNKAFITRMKNLGAPIFDTGPVGSNIASRWYAMERQILSGYYNYVKMF